MRSAVPFLLTAGLVASLAACAPTASTDSAAEGCAPSGSNSQKVSAGGDFGSKPEVSIQTPTNATETERSVVIEGDGETVVEGDIVRIEFTLLNGATGAELSTTEYGEATAQKFELDPAALLPGIIKTLECSTVGSRVVGVIPGVDAFGDEGQAQLGIEAGQDLVFVADVVEIVPPPEPALPRADGEDQEPTPGFPTVTLDADGRPTVAIPDTAPPSELSIAVLKKGDGPVVAAGDDVVVHYVGMNWASKVIFDESWARGEPATFNTTGVIPGFAAAIEGQTVGSQVIVIIPPELGYGEGDGDTNGTILFVVDILGIG